MAHIGFLLFQKLTIKHVERENDRGIKTQNDHKNTHPGTIKEKLRIYGQL
jgi:hypothetical protein